MPDSSIVKTVDVDAVPGLSEIVHEAIRAGEVLLTRGGEPVARIIPVLPPRGHARAPRRPGSARGMFKMADDFDDMPAEFDGIF
jgi:antitoxin (DNA-binding transcriptional repressor) of toxin-antitoxin stability system